MVTITNIYISVLHINIANRISSTVAHYHSLSFTVTHPRSAVAHHHSLSLTVTSRPLLLITSLIIAPLQLSLILLVHCCSLSLIFLIVPFHSFLLISLITLPLVLIVGHPPSLPHSPFHSLSVLLIVSISHDILAHYHSLLVSSIAVAFSLSTTQHYSLHSLFLIDGHPPSPFHLLLVIITHRHPSSIIVVHPYRLFIHHYSLLLIITHW